MFSSSIRSAIVHSCNSYSVYRQLRPEIISHHAQSILKFQFLYNMSLFLSKTKSATALFSPSRRTYITFVSKQYLVQNKTFPEIISRKKRNTVPPMDAKADTASY